MVPPGSCLRSSLNLYVPIIGSAVSVICPGISCQTSSTSKVQVGVITIRFPMGRDLFIKSFVHDPESMTRKYFFNIILVILKRMSLTVIRAIELSTGNII